MSRDDFQKNGTYRKSAHYPLCLYKSLFSFYLNPLSTAFEKVSGGIFFTHNFGFFFLRFLENYPPKSEVMVSMYRTVCEKLPCVSGYAQIFTEKLWHSEKPSFRVFDFFKIFLTFLECYPAESEILVSMGKKNVWKVFLHKRLRPSFEHTVMTLGKVIFSTF